jgi:hypothetical protein
MKPQHVTYQLARPRDDFPGRITEAWFIEKSGIVTLTSRDGSPLRNQDGREYSQKLVDGDLPRRTASRLLKQHYDATRGSRTRCFNDPIYYPRSSNKVA